MKTLVITSIYPSPGLPTAGPYNFQTFRPLMKHCELKVVSPLPCWSRFRRPSELFGAPWVDLDGIPSCYPTYWSIPRAPAMHARALYHSLKGPVGRLRRDFPFDVILATWAYPDTVAAAMLARRFRVPLVAKVHGSDINELTRFPNIRKQISRAFAGAEKVIAVSGALASKVEELGVPAERILVQHNAVDGARFSIRDPRSIREKLGLPQNRRLLCYVGRLGREKGVDLLLEAMSKLCAEGLEDTDLVIVGDGAESAALRDQHAKLGLGDRVRFVGSKLPPEIPDWIAACDILCLPSRREGCPNVVLEALASGKPVVACRVGGVPELLNETNGETVNPENPSALAAGIRRALDRTWDPQALRSTVQFLSWDDVAVSVHRSLEEAVARHHPANPRRLAAPTVP